MSSLLHSLGPIPTGQKIVAEMDAAKSKEFIRILCVITQIVKTWHCQITDSKISQWIGMNIFIELDLEGIIGKGVDMAFTLNGKILKNLRDLEVGEIIAIHSELNQCYTFFGTNTDYSILLNSMVPDQTTPVFSSSEYIGSPVSISEFDMRSIRRHLKKKKAGYLLVYDDQLEQFCASGGWSYLFNPNARSIIVGKVPNLMLTTHSFLAIVGKHDVSLKVARNQDGIWLITESTMSLGVEAVTYEPLTY